MDATKPTPTLGATKRPALLVKPGQSYTVKRGEARAQENAYLAELFGEWFGKVTKKELRADRLLEDLKDGTVLCDVLSRIPGSGLTKYHNPATNEFQSKENLVLFSKLTTTQLHFPTSCGARDFDEGNVGKVLSCLLYVAKVADKGKVTELTATMPEGLRERAEQEPDIVAPPATIEEGARQLSMFESIKVWIEESVQAVGEMVTGKPAASSDAEPVTTAATPPIAAN
jgi:hypothetical protein